MPVSTSALGAALPVAGTILQVSNSGSSPDSFFTIANITDLELPWATKEVEVTNIGDSYVRRITTLIDPGKVSFKIFWIPEEPTHRNSAGGGGVATGMRYLLLNKVLRDFQIIYANSDGTSSGSADAFSAYVAEFKLTGKTGSVWEASCILLVNTTSPSLV